MAEVDLTVESCLPATEPQGLYSFRLSTATTVEDLLKELCQRTRTALKQEYYLSSGDSVILHRADTLALSNVQNECHLQWGSTEVLKFRTRNRYNVFHMFAVIGFVLGFGGAAAVCIIKYTDYWIEQDFAIVFDAGSSHSAMFVFKWEASRMNGTAVATQFGHVCEAEGDGISKFSNNPQKAGPSLLSCIDQAKATIPSRKHATTPIYLGATAGMRLLAKLNGSASEAILNSVRETFRETPFQFEDPQKSVRILSGGDEGTFSWITSNYITNALNVMRPNVQGQPQYTIVSTIGAMDLGGASTQITFVPKNFSEVPTNFAQDLQLFGKNYTVYTFSHLCYGVNEIARRIEANLIMEAADKTDFIEHPCLPKGYLRNVSHDQVFQSACVDEAGPSNPRVIYSLTGTGDSQRCSDQIEIKNKLFENKKPCEYSRCSFNNAFQPELNGPFYAFSSFYYVAKFLDLLNGNATVEHQTFSEAANKICDTPWEQLEKLNVSKKAKESLMFYCLQASYINLLLSIGYRFTEETWRAISFVGEIFNTQIGWTLGFVLTESNGYPTEFPKPRLTTLSFALLLALCGLLLLMSIILTVEINKSHSDDNKRKQTSHKQLTDI